MHPEALQCTLGLGHVAIMEEPCGLQLLLYVLQLLLWPLVHVDSCIRRSSVLSL